jgi:hypothetical protein
MFKLWVSLSTLIWEGLEEMSTCQTSTVSDGPTLVFKAIEKGRKHFNDVWFEWLGVLAGNLGAKFRDAMASSFSDGVIVGHGLHGVELTNFGSEVCDDLSTRVTEHKLPGLLRVDLDALGDIVPVQAHSWDKQGIKLGSELLIFTNCEVEGPASLGSGISYLGPVV